MKKTQVERFWRTMGTVPVAVEHWDVLDSTNDRARSVCIELGYPALVTAAHQRSGRGRQGRSWKDEPNSALLMTLGFPPDFLEEEFPHAALMAVAAVSVLTVLTRYAPSQLLRLKYPNDVWAKPIGKPSGKLCGMLVETDYLGGQRGVTVVGIGLNMTRTPPVHDALYPIYCLADVATESLPPSPLLAETIAEDIMNRLLHQSPQQIMEKWQQQLAMVGRTVVLRPASHVVQVVGYTADGALSAQRLDTGEHLIIRDGDSLTYDPFAV